MELKSSATFSAIDGLQWTNMGEVINLAQNLLKRWTHVCVHRGKAVKVRVIRFLGDQGACCLETDVFYWLLFMLTNGVNHPCCPWQGGLNRMLLMNRSLIF